MPRDLTPDQQHDWVERELDLDRVFDERWEREARMDPASWVTSPLCPMCGRPLVARELCSACGDETDVAA